MKEALLVSALWIVISGTAVYIWATIQRRRHPPTPEMIESYAVLYDRRWLPSGWIGWVFTFVYEGSVLVRKLEGAPAALKAAGLVVPVLVLAWLIATFFREGKEADELAKLVRHDALALTFMMFLFWSMGMWLTNEIWPSPPSNARFSGALGFLPLYYGFALWLAKAKYMPTWKKNDAVS